MKTILLFALLCTISVPSAALTPGQTVTIGCSLSVPPFIIHQNNRGITLDLLRQSLAYEGIRLQLQYASNEDNVRAFNAGEIDGLCIGNPDTSPAGHFSTLPLVTFHNVAISLFRNYISLNSIDDLSRYRVQGFSMARHFLPAGYASAVESSPHYEEQPDQAEQVRALFSGTTDVIVMERTTFRYFLSQLRRQDPANLSTHQAYRMAELFTPTTYHAAFRSADLRDRFDRGFRQLTDSGEAAQISSSYETLLADYLFQ